MALRHLEARHLCDDFLEHLVDQLAVAAVDRADIAHVEPEPATGNRLDYFAPREIADIALAPQLAGTAGAGLHQAIMFARITFDQLGEIVHREGRRLLHFVLEPKCRSRRPSRWTISPS